jgi:prepilin-type processing-associated H-X9-DG protein
MAICPYAEEQEFYDLIESAGTNNGATKWSAAAKTNSVPSYYPASTNALAGKMAEYFMTKNTQWNVCPSWTGVKDSGKPGHTSYRANCGRGGTSTNIGTLTGANDLTGVGCGGMAARSTGADGIGLGSHNFVDGLSKTVIAWEGRSRGSLTGSSQTYTIFGTSRSNAQLYNFPWYDNKAPQGRCDSSGTVLVQGTGTSDGGPNPSSDHAGQLFNILMADGSVTTLGNDILPQIWGNMCYRDDGK